MEAYQKIESAINSVKEWNREAGNELHEQVHHAQHSQWSRKDLSEYIKSENDVAELYSQDDWQYDEIRNIQDMIINFYSEDDETIGCGSCGTAFPVGHPFAPKDDSSHCRGCEEDSGMSDAKKHFMHTDSGDVATKQEWRDDYDNMDIETWFGKDYDNITDRDRDEWLRGGHLVEVVMNNDGEWVEI